MPPAALILDDWNTLRRATDPGALRLHLEGAMVEEGLVKERDLFQDAFEYATAFHRTMTERDLREHTIEQILSLTTYTLGDPVPPTEPALARVTERALERNAAQVTWQVDAVPFLETVTARGLSLGLVANTIFGLGKSWEERLSKWFPVRVLSREFGFAKPHPAIFLEAASRLRVEATECAFVGDLLLTDVWGAQRAGMQAFWVERPSETQDLFRANEARLAVNLGVDLAGVQPAGRVTSLADLLPLVA